MTARTGKHTPGKWATLIPNGRTVASEGRLICDMADAPTLEEERANARLIAAAPELLEALQFLHDDIDEYQRLNNLGGHDNHGMVMARAAIAKAHGNE